MPAELYYLIPVFFFIALFYAAAGFGGGSSYLAVLAFAPLEFTDLRIIALLCNITVVSGSVCLFYRNGYLDKKRILPLIVLSIPFAFLGGKMRISEEIFFILLGFTLLTAALLMLFSEVKTSKKLPKYANAIIGSGIGFLSGVVGIGGGIFLSPLLYLSRWGTAKVIAGCTALFILVNSVAGLVGQVSAADLTDSLALTVGTRLMLAVFIGGQIGVHLTIFKLPPIMVKRVTAILIFIVALRILWKYF